MTFSCRRDITFDDYTVNKNRSRATVAQGTPNRRRPLIYVAVPRTRADMVHAMGVDGRRKRESEEW